MQGGLRVRLRVRVWVWVCVCVWEGVARGKGVGACDVCVCVRVCVARAWWMERHVGWRVVGVVPGGRMGTRAQARVQGRQGSVDSHLWRETCRRL